MTARRSGGYILVMCSYRKLPCLPYGWMGKIMSRSGAARHLNKALLFFNIQLSTCLDILTCLPCCLGSHAPLRHLGSLVVDAGMLSPGCGPLATKNMMASRILDSSSCGKLHRLTTETSSFLVHPRRFSRRSTTKPSYFLSRSVLHGSYLCPAKDHLHASLRHPHS